MRFAGAKLFLCFLPGRRFLALVTAGAFFAASASLPALAFELFGHKFFEASDETAVVPDAQPYTLEFNVAGGDRGLAKAIENASSLSRDIKRPVPGAAGLIARARGDYGRIVAALYGRGYYGGSVAITDPGRPSGGASAGRDAPPPGAGHGLRRPGSALPFRRDPHRRNAARADDLQGQESARS